MITLQLKLQRHRQRYKCRSAGTEHVRVLYYIYQSNHNAWVGIVQSLQPSLLRPLCIIFATAPYDDRSIPTCVLFCRANWNRALSWARSSCGLDLVRALSRYSKHCMVQSVQCNVVVKRYYEQSFLDITHISYWTDMCVLFSWCIV